MKFEKHRPQTNTNYPAEQVSKKAVFDGRRYDSVSIQTFKNLGPSYSDSVMSSPAGRFSTMLILLRQGIFQ